MAEWAAAGRGPASERRSSPGCSCRYGTQPAQGATHAPASPPGPEVLHQVRGCSHRCKHDAADGEARDDAAGIQARPGGKQEDGELAIQACHVPIGCAGQRRAVDASQEAAERPARALKHCWHAPMQHHLRGARACCLLRVAHSALRHRRWQRPAGRQGSRPRARSTTWLGRTAARQRRRGRARHEQWNRMEGNWMKWKAAGPVPAGKAAGPKGKTAPAAGTAAGAGRPALRQRLPARE